MKCPRCSGKVYRPWPDEPLCCINCGWQQRVEETLELPEGRRNRRPATQGVKL